MFRFIAILFRRRSLPLAIGIACLLAGANLGRAAPFAAKSTPVAKAIKPTTPLNRSALNPQPLPPGPPPKIAQRPVSWLSVPKGGNLPPGALLKPNGLPGALPR